jgi:hypothetical protein
MKKIWGPSRGCGRSTADTLHLVFDGSCAIGAKLVFGRFMSYGDSENFSQLLIRSTGAQQLFQGLVAIGQQAGAKLAVCRQAEAVTAVAEMMTQSADESDFSFGPP